MSHNNTHSLPSNGPHSACPEGLLIPIFGEGTWNPTVRIVVYFLSLVYCFIGVTIITEIFMSSIDRITSHTRKVYLAKTRENNDGSSDALNASLPEDGPEVIEVRVWNDTVANLILMAFGTASPEILLSVIETVGHDFKYGNLGAATIVGSAAFNLLVITGICMLALPDGEVRKILRLQVFIVTGVFSYLAYVWLTITLLYISPGKIELWEASITFILFPVLILFAYAADKNYFGLLKRFNKNNLQFDLEATPTGTATKENLEKRIVVDGQVDKNTLMQFVKEVKKFPGLSDHEVALLTASKLVDATTHSANWYRIGTCRKFSARRNIKPNLDNKLKEVYSIIKEHGADFNLDCMPKPPADTESCSVVEFHSPTVGVRESVGTFKVYVNRFGNLKHEVRVRVDSIDGSAKHGEDYMRVREVLTFQPNETEKQVEVTIVKDDKWESQEEFFLRLTVSANQRNFVKLGKYPIMEVKIIEDDEPGLFLFEKRGLVVKESAGTVSIPVIRIHGADGDASVKWKTIDKSAISGRDYFGGSGELHFKHNEIKQSLDIEIIDDLTPEKDEYFEVVLFEPTGGARIGNVNRMLVTISNDDDFNSIVHRFVIMTNANLDAIKMHSETWGEQIKQAMNVNGGDIENATTFDYVMHFLSFLWKVLFAFVPPAAIFNGWLCFFVSLIVIGILTTIIGDLAAQFGCFIKLDDTITAITIVALGTSLPDILGAKMVVCEEKYADGALIHISGSIAVNVLVGVGAPWLAATIIHKELVFEEKYYKGLGFSLLLYTIAAIIAVTLIIGRRKLKQCGNAEIGGPNRTRYLTAAVLISMWVLYIILTYLDVSGKLF